MAAAVPGPAFHHRGGRDRPGLLGKHGQSVVFRKKADDRAAFAVGEARPEGRGHAGNALFHGKALLFQRLRHGAAGTRFRKAEFGIVPYPVGKALKLLRPAFYGVKKLLCHDVSLSVLKPRLRRHGPRSGEKGGTACRRSLTRQKTP